MLLKLPSGETILLTLWEVAIVLAVAGFIIIVLMKISRPLMRFFRKNFSGRRRRRSRHRSSSEEKSAVQGSIHDGEFSNT